MKSETYISETDLKVLAGELLASGVKVLAPAKKQLPLGDRIEYAAVQSPDQMLLNRAPAANSLKEFIMPSAVALFRWRQCKSEVRLEECDRETAEQVVIGAHPCDAAALEIVDKVMDWDCHDDMWFERRKATTILSLACTAGDAACFCSAAGLAPDSNRGADVLLIPLGGGYGARIVTDKGDAFVKAHGRRFKDSVNQAPLPEVEASRKRIAANLNMDTRTIKVFLEKNFEHEMWKDIALRCHGCGACTFVCPTCHCFDIVDEPEGVDHGVRRRNWDTCQTAKFTAHASGHNPRHDQNSRIRQRLAHKFFIYPDRFGEVLCTGCGRCARVCPGGMNLPEALRLINSKA